MNTAVSRTPMRQLSTIAFVVSLVVLTGGCSEKSEQPPDPMAVSLMKVAGMNEEQAKCTSTLLQSSGLSDKRLKAITSGKGAFEGLSTKETTILEDINAERAECITANA